LPQIGDGGGSRKDLFYRLRKRREGGQKLKKAGNPITKPKQGGTAMRSNYLYNPANPKDRPEKSKV